MAPRARVPDVRWQIVGSNAGPAIQRLGLEQGITVRGYVEDIRDEVYASRVCLVPLHVAGGIRIKLLELMADARPSVATTVGAQGIDFVDGEGAFRRDDPVEFADATVRLLTDDDLWRTTGQAGWQLPSHHTQTTVSALREGIEMALARHGEMHDVLPAARSMREDPDTSAAPRRGLRGRGPSRIRDRDPRPSRRTARGLRRQPRSSAWQVYPPAKDREGNRERRSSNRPRSILFEQSLPCPKMRRRFRPVLADKATQTSPYHPYSRDLLQTNSVLKGYFRRWPVESQEQRASDRPPPRA